MTDLSDCSAARPRRTSNEVPGPHQLLIIDDHRVFGESLAVALGAWKFSDIVVASELLSVAGILERRQITTGLGNVTTRSGLLLVEAALDVCPDLRTIAIGVSADDEAGVLACARAGVKGFHTRSGSLEDLIVVIRQVAAGRSVCPPSISTVLLRRMSSFASKSPSVASGPALTDREIQILRMIELGTTNRDIATHLDIAVHTVKNHVHNVLTKLGVASRAEAATIARIARTERAAAPRI